MRPYGSRSPNPPEFVSELIDHTSANWDLERLEEICLPIDIPSIIQIPLCTSDIADSWVSNFEKKTGNYSIRSAYRMMVDIGQEIEKRDMVGWYLGII